MVALSRCSGRRCMVPSQVEQLIFQSPTAIIDDETVATTVTANIAHTLPSSFLEPISAVTTAITMMMINNNIDVNSVSDTNSDGSIGMLSKETTIIVFIIGVIPFIIATYEFWRRIAVGLPFGTNADSVVFPNSNNSRTSNSSITTTTTTTTTSTTGITIGMDNDPSSSRGKQLLGQDSLITAYLIFATVAVVLSIVFYSVLTSPIPPSS